MIELSRRSRGLIALLFALLLLGMQQESLRHAFSHFTRASEQNELSAPQSSVACVECALLAEGSTAIPSAALVFTPSARVDVSVQPAHVAPTLAPRNLHRSRAPPFLS